MENWLSIVVGVYLLAMVLHGHYKGFIRLAVSMVALIATLVIVNLGTPVVSRFLREQTPFNDIIKESLEKAIHLDKAEDSFALPAAQRTVIENLNLPEQLKEMLIENNNNEVYRLLNVDAFTDYIGSYLAGIIMNVLGFAIMFLVVFLLIHVVMRWLDLVARLPILSGINQIAGALLGGIQGLVFFWIFCIIITMFSATAWGISIFGQIADSSWLSFLYQHNILAKIVMGVIQGMA